MTASTSPTPPPELRAIPYEGVRPVPVPELLEQDDPYVTSCAFITLSAKDVHMQTSVNLWEIKNEKYPVRVDGWIPQPCGPYLDDGRNIGVEQFLEHFPETEWAIMWDSDVSHENIYSQVVELLRAGMHLGASVIGGAYLGVYQGQIGTVAARRVTIDGQPTLVNVSKEEVESEPTPTPVDMLGTGFMAIHRSLLERMGNLFARPQRWFDEPVWFDGVKDVHLGEDWGFCTRIRELGLLPILHRGVRLVHHKNVGLQYDS